MPSSSLIARSSQQQSWQRCRSERQQQGSLVDSHAISLTARHGWPHTKNSCRPDASNSLPKSLCDTVNTQGEIIARDQTLAAVKNILRL